MPFKKGAMWQLCSTVCSSHEMRVHHSTCVKEVASVNFSVMTLGGTELKILQKSGSIEYSLASRSAQMDCTVLHCTALHCTALYCTTLHCTALHSTALHCTALHCTALHCTALPWLRWAATCRREWVWWVWVFTVEFLQVGKAKELLERWQGGQCWRMVVGGAENDEEMVPSNNAF